MSYILLSAGPPVGPPGALPQPTPDELGNFQAALGSAIATWQLVELMLQFTFQAIIDSQNKTAVSAAYHAVVNFRGRLSMIDSAMAAKHTGSKTLVDWRSLSQQISRHSRKRNVFAHCLIYYDPDAKVGRRVFLGQAVTIPKMLGEIKNVRKSAIYYNDMIEIIRSFETIRGSLQKFSMEMPGSVFS